ncbi:MAG TPA: S1 RNA-binding domain-containing protein [Acidimicrobiales bacterium]|nr:S1 RNA-binding domain-containing protein [Acidimicrobiales bacterium]
MAPTHLVVDGSNIATEGRSLPSLKQLDEAVRAFLKERPHDTWTVVVDATFEHRIDSSEKKMFEEALAANEMVIPPAGTIGRGDKFLLEIADRANATVFSNDSFQEFHGEYTWLFDDGRLVGGKPVAEVGWIFTERTPVRGPKSRQATRSADRRGRLKSPQRVARKKAEASAELGPPPVPTEPPPRGRLGRRRAPAAAEAAAAAETSEPASSSKGRSGRRRTSSSPAPEPVNEPLPFIEFIAEHGPGSTVEGEVTAFASHGAYVQVGDVRCYLELKLMGDPPPNAAREVLTRGEVRTFVVQAIDAPRRGIDLALPGFEQLAPEDREAPAAKAPARKRAATKKVAEESPAEEAPAAKAPARKRTAKKKATEEAPAEEAPAAKAPARKRTAKKKATEQPTTEEAPAKAPARKRAANKKATEEASAGEAPAAKAPARKRAAKKKSAEEPTPEETPSEETPAKKAPARKRAAKKKAAEEPTTEETPSQETPAKKAPARKRAAKKAAATEASTATATTPGRGRHRRGGGGTQGG